VDDIRVPVTLTTGSVPTIFTCGRPSSLPPDGQRPDNDERLFTAANEILNFILASSSFLGKREENTNIYFSLTPGTKLKGKMGRWKRKKEKKRETQTAGVGVLCARATAATGRCWRLVARRFFFFLQRRDQITKQTSWKEEKVEGRIYKKKNVHVAAATPHSLSYGPTMEINELVVITGQVRQSLIAGHFGLEGRK
jgi:hypothetical protein